MGGFGTAGSANLALDNQFSYGDNLTWQHGRHISKFGAQLFRAQNNFYQNNSGGLLGGFNYSGAFTGDPALGQAIGYDFADFLLDYSSSYSVSEQTGDVGLRQYRFAFFAQDDFKLMPNLTVNYGVRWEFDQPMYEVHNKLSDINPATGALELAGQSGNSSSLYASTKDDIDPRIGFAWNPDMLHKKLVLRGGFGITTYMDYNLLHNHVGNAPFHIGIAATATTPTSTTSGSPFAVTNGFGTSGATTTGVSFNAWNTLKPMMEPQYSMVAEYAINGKQSVTVAYVGNLAQHLGDERNINQETLVATPSSAAFDSTTISTPTGQRRHRNQHRTALRVGSLLELQRRRSHVSDSSVIRARISVELHVLEGAGRYLRPRRRQRQQHCRRRSAEQLLPSLRIRTLGQRQPSHAQCSWVYHMPFGRGQQFGGNVPTWLDEVVGGWTLSGSAVLFSGQPNTITANGSSGATGAGTLRANHYRPMVGTGAWMAGTKPVAADRMPPIQAWMERPLPVTPM